MSRRAPTPPPKVVQEEIEFDEEEDEEMDEYPDMFEALGSLLATDEGETIATALVSTKDATERIATSLELQNKILVKILSAINKPCMCKTLTPPSSPVDESA
jgi:hypothetical protein